MKDSYARTNNFCLVFLTLVAATGALAYMRPVLVPLIFSIFTYSVITPLVRLMESKAKVPRLLAVLLSTLVMWLIFSLVVLVLINSVEKFIAGTPKYKESVASVVAYADQFLGRFNLEVGLKQVQDMITSLPLFKYAQNLTSHLLAFFANLFLVFIFTVFMMTGESKAETKSNLITEVLEKISSYISAKLFLSVLTGSIVWLVLLSFGIELSFVFALLTVLLNFIPTIGSIVAVALPLPIVFLQYQFGWPFFAVLGITGATQFTIGNILEPKVLGESMDLHPITVLICLIFWGMVWGVSGLFLAVPITAIIKIVFSRIEATQVLAEVLAGRLPTKHIS